MQQIDQGNVKMIRRQHGRHAIEAIERNRASILAVMIPEPSASIPTKEGATRVDRSESMPPQPHTPSPIADTASASSARHRDELSRSIEGAEPSRSTPPTPSPADKAEPPQSKSKGHDRTDAERLQIMIEADEAKATGVHGAVGKVLKKYGASHANLTMWRKNREAIEARAAGGENRTPVPSSGRKEQGHRTIPDDFKRAAVIVCAFAEVNGDRGARAAIYRAFSLYPSQLRTWNEQFGSIEFDKRTGKNFPVALCQAVTTIYSHSDQLGKHGCRAALLKALGVNSTSLPYTWAKKHGPIASPEEKKQDAGPKNEAQTQYEALTKMKQTINGIEILLPQTPAPDLLRPHIQQIQTAVEQILQMHVQNDGITTSPLPPKSEIVTPSDPIDPAQALNRIGELTQSMTELANKTPAPTLLLPRIETLRSAVNQLLGLLQPASPIPAQAPSPEPTLASVSESVEDTESSRSAPELAPPPITDTDPSRSTEDAKPSRSVADAEPSRSTSPPITDTEPSRSAFPPRAKANPVVPEPIAEAVKEIDAKWPSSKQERHISTSLVGQEARHEAFITDARRQLKLAIWAEEHLCAHRNIPDHLTFGAPRHDIPPGHRDNAHEIAKALRSTVARCASQFLPQGRKYGQLRWQLTQVGMEALPDELMRFKFGDANSDPETFVANRLRPIFEDSISYG